MKTHDDGLSPKDVFEMEMKNIQCCDKYLDIFQCYGRIGLLEDLGMVGATEASELYEEARKVEVFFGNQPIFYNRDIK